MLRLSATGSFKSAISDGLGIHNSTVCGVNSKVSKMICRSRARHIKFPTTRREQQEMKEDSNDVAGMPNVLGAIDGRLIITIIGKE